MTELKTVTEIIRHFGGQTALARKLGIKQPNVWRWKIRNSFPANTYTKIRNLLCEDNCRAPDSLWGMRE